MEEVLFLFIALKESAAILRGENVYLNGKWVFTLTCISKRCVVHDQSRICGGKVKKIHKNISEMANTFPPIVSAGCFQIVQKLTTKPCHFQKLRCCVFNTVHQRSKDSIRVANVDRTISSTNRDIFVIEIWTWLFKTALRRIDIRPLQRSITRGK